MKKQLIIQMDKLKAYHLLTKDKQDKSSAQLMRRTAFCGSVPDALWRLT